MIFLFVCDKYNRIGSLLSLQYPIKFGQQSCGWWSFAPGCWRKQSHFG